MFLFLSVGRRNITSPRTSIRGIVDPYQCLSRLLHHRTPAMSLNNGETRGPRNVEARENASFRHFNIPLGVLYTRVSACLCAGQCNTSSRDTVVGREEKSVAIKRHALPRPRDIGPGTRETDILTYRAHIHSCIYVCVCLRSIFLFCSAK